LWTEFFTNRDWPVASALATVLLVVLVGPMMLLQMVQRRRGDR
jgi:putrescine transport system permease protein